MIRVLIADDHQVVRTGLKLLLEQETDIAVVGEGENGQEILSLLVSGVEADIVLTDVSMPVMDGMELARQLADRYPEIKVILLTIQEEESYVQKAFHSGVKSYLFKTSDSDEVIYAIRQVAKDQPYLCSALSSNIIKRMNAAVGSQQAVIGDIKFSEREMEVLRLIAEGYTNEEAAEKLFTSKRTVEGHRQAMIDKTGSRNSLGLVSFAMRNRLIS